MYNCKNMFEINYFQQKIKDWEKKKVKLLSLMGERNLNYVGSNYTTYNPIDEDIKLENEIKIIFSEELNDLKYQIGFENYKIDYVWFQEELNNMHHPVHNHGYGISCICYLDFDPSCHYPTVFLSPYIDPISGLYEKYIPDDVESGTIIFFPSTLLHYTLPNTSQKSRKILSFNLKFNT